MAHTYEELKKKTIAELRDIAKDIQHEAVQGYTQLNKDHLLPALCKALGIDSARASRRGDRREGGGQGKDARAPGGEGDGPRERGPRPRASAPASLPPAESHAADGREAFVRGLTTAASSPVWRGSAA